MLGLEGQMISPESNLPFHEMILLSSKSTSTIHPRSQTPLEVEGHLGRPPPDDAEPPQQPPPVREVVLNRSRSGSSHTPYYGVRCHCLRDSSSQPANGRRQGECSTGLGDLRMIQSRRHSERCTRRRKHMVAGVVVGIPPKGRPHVDPAHAVWPAPGWGAGCSRTRGWCAHTVLWATRAGSRALEVMHRADIVLVTRLRACPAPLCGLRRLCFWSPPGCFGCF